MNTPSNSTPPGSAQPPAANGSARRQAENGTRSLNGQPSAQYPAATQAAPRPPRQEADSQTSRVLWQGKIGPAFWTIASVLSLIVNVILIAVLLALASQLFAIKKLVGVQLIGGLHSNFVEMDKAHIITTIAVSDTIKVEDTIPVVFTLPLRQETNVVLTKDTYISKATVYLNNAPVPTDIILKKGTLLSIFLDMDIPVNQTVPVVLNVPVSLTVPVDIPLDQTDLHEPFVGLQGVVAPYKTLMDKLPNSWSELLCGMLPDWICK